eukprot:6542322-Alexandrium_andersonii.AAC.1
MDGRSCSKLTTARPWSRRRATCSGRARPSRARWAVMPLRIAAQSAGGYSAARANYCTPRSFSPPSLSCSRQR